jgi:hypothetical protein
MAYCQIVGGTVKLRLTGPTEAFVDAPTGQLESGSEAALVQISTMADIAYCRKTSGGGGGGDSVVGLLAGDGSG